MENFIKLKDGIIKATYIYVDCDGNLADTLFAEEKVRVSFGREWMKESYKIVFCKVRKKDANNFERALKKLENKMLLIGHKDYIPKCKEIFKLLGM